MDLLNDTAHKLSESAQVIYAMVAVTGGIARYLNSFTKGEGFRLSIFLASGFVAGFSGWMFAQIGISMNLQPAIIYTMAGTGGFFGEQTMKYVLEWSRGKAKI